MSKWKRVVSVLMAVLMLQSMISVSAFAASEQSDDTADSRAYYVVSGANDTSNNGTYDLSGHDLKEALNKVGDKASAENFAAIDVYNATINDLIYPNSAYAMQNLRVTLHNCTVNTWGFQIGCAGNVTWEFDDCEFLRNMLVMYNGGTTAPIDFTFINCDFEGTFNYQGCTIGDMTMKDCRGLQTANASNCYDPINAPLLNPYIHKNSKGEDAKLSVIGCTYINEQNQVNALLAYGGSFASYEFTDNKWADGSDIYVKAYLYTTYYGNDPALLEKDGVKLDTQDGRNVSCVSSGDDYFWHVLVDGCSVAHVQGLQADGTPNIVGTDAYPIQNNTTLTDKVSAGYLYGGAFTDAACTQPAFSNGEAYTGFTPAAGETYYIWEVSESYLIPKTTAVWRHVDGQETVTQLYLMTPIDRLLYSEVGFTLGDASRRSEQSGQDTAYGQVEITKNGQPDQVLYVENGVMKLGKYPAPTTADGGYIGMYKLTQEEFSGFRETPLVFRPYWVTLDGVRVTGTVERTCTYLQPGSSKIQVAETKVSSEQAAAETASAQSLTFAAAYSYDGDPNAVDVPDTLTVTVRDGGNTSTVTAARGEDLTGKLTYAGADGKRFAGWFTDEACTVPADLSDVQEDMTVYAKYVSDSLLRSKFVQQRLFGSEVWLFSAVDSGAYAETGFVVNGTTVPADYTGSKYSVYSARVLFGSGVGKDAKLIVGSCPVKGMHRGDTLTVQPYWITADGTTVYGEERTLTYGRFGLQG